jgi:sugar-specific transcriptional regulator TrmB
MTTDTISAALRRLELSDGEQVVYISLLRAGRATARILADRTGLTRPSVYDQLKKLITLNLVVELDVGGKAHFAAGDIKHLDALLLDRIDRLEQSRQFLLDALPSIEAGLDTVVPKIRFFEGEDGMKQLMKDLMWYDHITVLALWNDSEMQKIFDAAFLRWWNERRILRQISIQWRVQPVEKSMGKRKTSASTPALYDSVIDTLLPADMKSVPLMTELVYENKVAHISSQKEAFGFIVESVEYATLQHQTVETFSDTKRG